MLADDDRTHPTACACKWHLSFDDAIPPSELHSRTALLLSEVGGGLEKNAGRLIGHIKGLVDADEKGHLAFSVTSLQEGARFKGEVVGEVTEAILTLNVIVYGIEKEVVERMLEAAFARHFHGRRFGDDRGEVHAQ